MEFFLWFDADEPGEAARRVATG
ncbi:hypothetical protein RB2654_08757 [Rhodobacterales bacterium HTCC2654]|uniref:Uncharacterized protein n=1 Tax=Maritimibacter alkaliphilus HTCC2654 TaxID=314271 RepID=A3VHU2_9RHOB|nr:hypothetical protein RB2654_08757 [Rhodobacterales bacterium HTCC2654] [Maritimibacter alkaliphilus HTCC2654]